MTEYCQFSLCFLKELILQQNKYECCIETMRADLELADSKVKALQGQVNSLGEDAYLHSTYIRQFNDNCYLLHKF